MCVCGLGECLREQVFYMKKKGKMGNTGRSRDRRHGQTVKAVTFFSSGTLTSHLSCLLKRKEEGETMDFSSPLPLHLLFNKLDDKALSTHKVTSSFWNWNNATQSQRGIWPHLLPCDIKHTCMWGCRILIWGGGDIIFTPNLK